MKNLTPIGQKNMMSKYLDLSLFFSNVNNNNLGSVGENVILKYNSGRQGIEIY